MMLIWFWYDLIIHINMFLLSLNLVFMIWICFEYNFNFKLVFNMILIKYTYDFTSWMSVTWHFDMIWRWCDTGMPPLHGVAAPSLLGALGGRRRRGLGGRPRVAPRVGAYRLEGGSMRHSLHFFIKILFDFHKI